jgi:murein DD-endopeptidase / murein LD-carboxypeptidase
MNLSSLKTISLCLHVICGFALISLSFHHAFAKETTTKRLASGSNDKAPHPDELIQADMKKYLGVPYRRAGASKKGFDCSGFVKVVYNEIFGVELPHQSSQQSLASELVGISLDSLRTGDLVFFSTSGKNKAVNHVGIYLSDGKFIHAARSKGVVVSELNQPYWRSKIVGARRLAGGTGLTLRGRLLTWPCFLTGKTLFFFAMKNLIPPRSHSPFLKDTRSILSRAMNCIVWRLTTRGVSTLR